MQVVPGELISMDKKKHEQIIYVNIILGEPCARTPD